MYEEVYRREFYAKASMDSRSFSLSDANTGKTYGWMYRAAGLTGIKKASGRALSHWGPLVQSMLKPDPQRRHIVTGEMGAPQLYIFSDCINTIREIGTWAWKDPKNDATTPKEEAEDRNNHAMTALGYAVQIPLRYQGDLYAREQEAGQRANTRARHARGELGYRRT